MQYELRKYLISQGYENVFCDYMPSVTDYPYAINLSKWEHTVGDINDGTGMHYIQVQVRSPTAEEAHDTCAEIFRLIDSGTEETLIHLAKDTCCIARPRRGVILLERSAGSVTYYCEIALWGEN